MGRLMYSLYKREIILVMASKRNVVNALAILTILICGAGLAGSLIEQIDGSRAAEPQTESSPQTSFASESESVAANETVPFDEELIRFTLAEFPQPKICEIVAVAMGMLIGIFALFSGVTERQSCYVWGLVLAFVDAALSSGMLAFVLYILINSDTFVGNAESFTTRWTILLPAAAMALNIPLKITIGVLSTKLMRNFDEYSTN